MKKFYAGIVLVLMIGVLALTGCPSPAGDDPVYAISLDQTGVYIFPGAAAGYGEQAAKAVTVTNMGNRETGALTIAKSGTNADSFTVSGTGLDSIAVGGEDSFTVAPAAGLAAGVYTAVITVSGDNDISASFNVSFTVTPPALTSTYSISLSETGTHVFSPAIAGYSGAPEAYSVTVTNTGSQPTGALTIAKSGANPEGFTVSGTGLNSIAVGGSDSFTVVPVTGLAAGTYAAAVTVSGDNNISAGFDLSFTVTPSADTPVYGIGLSQNGAYSFPAAEAGYGEQAPLSVTVTNTGNRETGALTIAKSGTNADSFTVSKTGISNIAAGGNDSFTVVPNAGLTEGTYTAAVTVSGENGISAGFELSFTVNTVDGPADPAYGISLSQPGAYSFPAAEAGYGEQAPLSVTVTNTGSHATGALTIEQSGTNAGSFTVSKTGISDIAVDGDDSFTVVPNTGLAAGTYTATITVSGGHGISAGFDLNFTVNTVDGPADPAYGISLSKTGTHTFPAASTGYTALTPQSITVSNTGSAATGALTIGKSGTNAGSFTVTPASLGSIAAGGTGSFTVVPNTGLAAGTYTATITVSGENSITASFTVSFTVNAADGPSGPAYGISLSKTGTHTFPAASTGYTAQTPQSITVSNTGSAATGALTIGKSGANAGNFTVTPASLGSIAAGGIGSFTVRPNTELEIGIYTATITVSGANSITASFTVSFTVAAGLSANANLAALSVSSGFLDQTFSASTTSYTVTVPNITSSIIVSATVADTGKATLSPSFPYTATLAEGANTIRIRVTAENGATKDYTIVVTRTPRSANANLGSLSVAQGSLSPAFSPNTTAYTVLVSSGTSDITVTAAVADVGKASIEQSPANPVPLTEDSTLITLTVTAENGDTTKVYTITVNKTAAANAVNVVVIDIADERIDLTRSTENDLSREAGNTLRLTAPEGYTGYTWSVDGNTGSYNPISENEIQLYPGNNYSLGTHSVLLEYTKDGIPYGCEILFKVVR